MLRRFVRASAGLESIRYSPVHACQTFVRCASRCETAEMSPLCIYCTLCKILEIGGLLCEADSLFYHNLSVYQCTYQCTRLQSTIVPVYTSVPNEPVYQCTKLTSVPCTSVLGVPDDYSINIMGSVCTSVPTLTSVPVYIQYSVPCTSVLGVPDDYSINIMGSVFCVTAE